MYNICLQVSCRQYCSNGKAFGLYMTTHMRFLLDTFWETWPKFRNKCWPVLKILRLLHTFLLTVHTNFKLVSTFWFQRHSYSKIHVVICLSVRLSESETLFIVVLGSVYRGLKVNGKKLTGININSRLLLLTSKADFSLKLEIVEYSCWPRLFIPMVCCYTIHSTQYDRLSQQQLSFLLKCQTIYESISHSKHIYI